MILNQASLILDQLILDQLILDQTIQFSSGAPMNNMKAKMSTGCRTTRVADLTKHEIVAALNPIYVPSPWQFFHLCADMNPDATP